MTYPTMPFTSLVDPDLHTNGDPHEVWHQMREQAPVCRHPVTDFPEFWSLTRYDDIRAVYRDPATFSSAHGVLLRPVRNGTDPGGGLTLALTDPPRHRHIRSVMAGWFDRRAVRLLRDRIDGAVRAVLARAVERGECDFAHDVAARLSLAVIGGIVGVPDPDLEDLFHWTNEAFGASGSLAAHQQLMRYFLDLMYARMTEPADDLMSALVNTPVDGELLSEEEIVLNIENLVGATENGRLALIGGMLAFMEYPDQWRRLREDRGLMPSAVEEVLRWTSSATHSMRTATRPVVIRDQRIAAGDRVVLWVPSANRDEDVFADPYRFDVGRAPNRHLALGSGEHFCIGSILARSEMSALFGALLDTVDRVEPAGPVVPVRSIAVSGPEHLPVRVHPK